LLYGVGHVPPGIRFLPLPLIFAKVLIPSVLWWKYFHVHGLSLIVEWDTLVYDRVLASQSLTLVAALKLDGLSKPHRKIYLYPDGNYMYSKITQDPDQTA